MTIATGDSPELLVPWDEIESVAVEADDVMGDVRRILTFEHVSGEFFEIPDQADGWERAIAHLGDHMDLLMDMPLQASRVAGPGTAPIELARRREVRSIH
ncbi:hypothetical protein ASG80_17275 [Agromyces sp. Soil535]|nr:hypothetical protein ASG80_17275 [Agromyces sp. Soil535]